MAKTTDKRIGAAEKIIDLMEFLFAQPEPLTLPEIASGLGEPSGTVRCYLFTALDRKWVKQVGNCFEPGSRIPGMYAAYKMGIEHKINTLQRDLTALEA